MWYHRHHRNHDHDQVVNSRQVKELNAAFGRDRELVEKLAGQVRMILDDDRDENDDSDGESASKYFDVDNDQGWIAGKVWAEWANC